MQPHKQFVLSLQYNGRSSFLFINVTESYQFKVEDSEIKTYALCLAIISKGFAIINLKKKRD